MPVFRRENMTPVSGSSYPAPFDEGMGNYRAWAFSNAAGLTQFGAAYEELAPGAAASQRHWHEGEDEIVVMLAGEAVLVDDAGEHVMRPGDIAAFPKGDGNGHVLRNLSDAPCSFVAVGRPAATDCHYPDIDMHLTDGRGFHRKDGSDF